MDRAKQIWENLADKDAYFAVVTCDEFRRRNLDEEGKERFFQGGRDHVEKLWDIFEKVYGRVGRPKRGLDYGCGVGRILIALAAACDTVVGVDISDTMLAEARKNCLRSGVMNVELQSTDEFAAEYLEKYDFVHSYIVFQHVKPKKGYEIIRTIVQRLEPEGVGMLHVTFSDPLGGFRKFRARIYRDIPFLHRFFSWIRGIESQFVPMYEYQLSDVFRILEENECHECEVRFSDHGLLGAMIFFRKRATKLY